MRHRQAVILRDVFNPFRGRQLCRTAGVVEADSWLTPAVLSVAEAAYHERGKACRQCGGTGHRRVVRVTKGCVFCGGTGRVGEDALNPDRLAILADILEDAGCMDTGLLRHLRGWEPCSSCAFDGGEFYPAGWCAACNGTEDTVNGGWIRRQAYHVRGCWALDLVLGKE